MKEKKFVKKKMTKKDIAYQISYQISDIAIISGITNMVKTIILVITNTPQKTYRIAQYTLAWYRFHSLVTGRTNLKGRACRESMKNDRVSGGAHLVQVVCPQL